MNGWRTKKIEKKEQKKLNINISVQESTILIKEIRNESKEQKERTKMNLKLERKRCWIINSNYFDLKQAT